MAKTDTLFMTKTAEKPYPLGRTNLYCPYKGVPLPGGFGSAIVSYFNFPVISGIIIIFFLLDVEPQSRNKNTELNGTPCVALSFSLSCFYFYVLALKCSASCSCGMLLC